MQPATGATANTIAQRDGSAYLTAAVFQTSDANTRMLKGSNNSLRIQTNSGYVEIGPKNTGYCHIYTDRAQFAFNAVVNLNAVQAARLVLPVGANRWAPAS